MTRLRIVVEGQTEKAFVEALVRGALWEAAGLDVSATTIVTRRDLARGLTHRGGHGGHYAHIRRDVLTHLKSDPSVIVTTMLDLYGIPSDFPGRDACGRGTPEARASCLEAAFSSDIAHPRFIPNLLVHEFEALLFASPDAIETVLETGRPTEIARIVEECGSPEAIDDGPETAPSKRLLRLHPSYRKAIDGPLIAQVIGLADIRSRCPHFDAWLRRLESLQGAKSHPTT